jgi:hypothetical protein
MEIKSTRACFDALVAKGPNESLRGLTGVWELDLEGEGVWSLRVDDGRLSASQGPSTAGPPNASFRMPAKEFVRIAGGVEHSSLLTGVLRGAVRVEGDLRFAQRLEVLLPIADEKGIPS